MARVREGECVFGGTVESAKVQALWSHAIGPFFDLQAGVRYDFAPDSRAHTVLGVQGLAPYMSEVDAAALLSDKGASRQASRPDTISGSPNA